MKIKRNVFKLPKGRGFCWLNKLFNCSRTMIQRNLTKGGKEFACGLQTVGSFFQNALIGGFPWDRIHGYEFIERAPCFIQGFSVCTCTHTLLFIFVLYPFENIQMIQLEFKSYFVNFDVYILITFLKWLNYLNEMYASII